MADNSDFEQVTDAVVSDLQANKDQLTEGDVKQLMELMKKAKSIDEKTKAMVDMVNRVFEDMV